MNELNRRQFLSGISLAVAATPLPAVALADGATSFAPVTYAARAVYQQQTFIDLTGHADRYTPPQGNHSTRVYRASLSDEEFLRRHWFS
ncbi:MAG TPA: hypothetical protein VMH83_06760 [Candidatus Acidoferrum sp.]|nr:hypothetical protein [Candidatus Acidoferrum sp.]